jgi:hypothetical protein
MSKPIEGPRSYTLPIEFDPRVATVHLGERKYTTPGRAIAELVANGFDANARVVRIKTEYDKDLGIERALVVEDDGTGIAPDVLAKRLSVVGVLPEAGPAAVHRFAQFGVGHLAVHRIGSVSSWTTVCQTVKGKIKSTFVLRVDGPKSFSVTEEPVPASTPTGTSIRIEELKAFSGEALMPYKIGGELLAQFCAYLLAHPDRTIEIQGQPLQVSKMIEQQVESKTDLGPELGTLTINHVVLDQPVDQSRFPHQVLLTNKGRTVHTLQPEEPLSRDYLALAECSYLEAIVTANRESIITLDPLYGSLEQAVMTQVVEFDRQRLDQRQLRFIEEARKQEYYPYKEPPTDGVTAATQVIYDVVLERINETANLQGMPKKQQAVVFKLLRRALENQYLFEVLREVATLSDQDVEKFREVLERTTLNSIIHLASEVTDRLVFLDMLHELVYGEHAKHLKERSQLHRILESKCWLFGPKFHLATSDQSFREVVRRHRELAGLPKADPEDVAKIQGVEDIPDLFLACTKDYPHDPRNNHLLVELKAPRVAIGPKELQQAKKYANTVVNSAEFDTRSVAWEIFLVSAKVSDEVDPDRKQNERPVGLVSHTKSMKLWVFTWAELINDAKTELQLVRDHLRAKSQQLSVSEYLRHKFPEVAASILTSRPEATTAQK